VLTGLKDGFQNVSEKKKVTTLIENRTGPFNKWPVSLLTQLLCGDDGTNIDAQLCDSV
jgi:hypothetical protein